MKLDSNPGAYVIECLANSACYVGGTVDLKKRVTSHLAKLRAGRHELPLLQADWQRFGPGQFVIWVQNSPQTDDLEREACLILNGLEECGGYTKSLIRSWGLSARIRDSERKYLRRGKFCRIKAIDEHQRINPDYIRTFCQGNVPMTRDAAPQIVVKDVQRAVLRRDLLSGFIRLDAAFSPTITAKQR